MPAECRRDGTVPASGCRLAIGRSPWSTWISTEGWLSDAVEKTSLFRVGIVVFASISFVITPPSVSMPSDSGVTSSRSTSVTSPESTPPWIAAPTATTSSGLTPLWGSRPKMSLHELLHLRHARHAADQDHFIDLLRRQAGILQCPFGRSERPLDQVVHQLLELRPGERHVQMLRARPPSP